MVDVMMLRQRANLSFLLSPLFHVKQLQFMYFLFSIWIRTASSFSTFSRSSVFLCSHHQFRDVIRINIHPNRVTTFSLSNAQFSGMLWAQFAVGRNAQILLTQKLFLKYSMLFHHYSNYHMLRSGSQQIAKVPKTRKYGVVCPRYGADDGNSSCSLVTNFESFTQHSGCFGRCILKSILFINGLLYPFSFRAS